MNALPKSLTRKAKLKLLQKLDEGSMWASLDEARHCVLCERTICGEEIAVMWDEAGTLRLACPTRGCRATPREWLHPGNPLIDESAWHDWVRLLDGLCDSPAPAPHRLGRRFRPSDQAPTRLGMRLGR
ncbi:MAG TPA: hypothetical protein VNQ90_16815 [Chthoniobacteraceae bacterium]|nr:hypothetical protein [Chthoniobacteraceae bacterium]